MFREKVERTEGLEGNVHEESGLPAVTHQHTQTRPHVCSPFTNTPKYWRNTHTLAYHPCHDYICMTETFQEQHPEFSVKLTHSKCVAGFNSGSKKEVGQKKPDSQF